MCEVVEISDDEDSLVLEEDVGDILKDEVLDYDLTPQTTCSSSGPGDVASSSGSNLRSSFIGMGFKPFLVDKAIEENGEGNADSILEALFMYSKLQQAKLELPDGSFSQGNNDSAASIPGFHKSESSNCLDRLFGSDVNKTVYLNGDFPLKEEPDVHSGVDDKKMTSLLKMNFSLDEAWFAINRLGKEASISQLMDFIFAARMAKKYERGSAFPIPEDDENKKDSSNEALFGIMDKTLQLLEIGFNENEISAAFERCGSEAPVTELAESIVVPDYVPNKYSSTSLSTQINNQILKRKMGDCLNDHAFDPVHIKSEECCSSHISQVATSNLIEKLKGKMPRVESTFEPNNWKEPKEEFNEDLSSSAGRMLLEAKRANSTSTSKRLVASQRQIARMESLEEDIKPILSMPIPCKSLSSVVAKPPYFLYGNVTSLSRDSWVKISQFLYSVRPEFVDTQLYSALSRQEGYIHNLPNEDRFHILPKGPMTIEDGIPLSKKWWPSWDQRKKLSYINCETSGISQLCDRLGKMLVESRGHLSAEQQRNIILQCEEKNLVWVGNNKLAPIEPEHLERIMGYPLYHSRVSGVSSSERFRSLKLSFQTDALGYYLSVLRSLFPGGLTILSFFSGIGGVEVALHRLGIQLKGLVSVEPCETKRKIVKQWWENTGQSGELIQFESTHKLSSSKLEGFIKKFSGFDFVVCQNPYSSTDSDSLAGLDFSMFVEFVRVLQRVRSTMERSR